LIESAKNGGVQTPADDTRHYSGVAEKIGFLSRRSWWFNYGFALALTVMAVVLRRTLDVLGEGIVPFALFYPVVLACTLVGGRGPGLMSLAISGVAVTLFWLEPRGVLSMTPTGLVNMILFALSNGALIGVAHLLRTSYGNLRQSEARLSLSQDVGKIGIWDFDLRTGALWWSSSFYDLAGLDRDQPPSVKAMIDRIHPDDRPRAIAAFEAARDGRDRLDLEFRYNRDDGATVWMAGRAELFRDAKGRPVRLLGVNFDVTPMRTIESERDRAHTMLQTFFDSLPGAAYVKDTEGRVLLGNRGMAEAVGCPTEEFTGRTDLEFMRDKEQARAIMAHDRMVLDEGVSKQLDEELALPDGRMSHWLSVKTPFRDADGQLKGIVGISLDMTERHRAERRLRFLADEVDHRAKNLLAVVQSIVRLTRVEDVADFKTVLTGRIQALGRAHSLLASNRWDGIELAALLREELAPFGRGTEQIRIAGPSLLIGPNASQALAMVLHELAINAARHGALSVEGGQLSVVWRLAGSEGAARLELGWQEACGPTVVMPANPGFGFTAVRGAIEHQLGGQVVIDWAPQGVRCRITFPAAGNVVEDRPGRAPQEGAPPEDRPGTLGAVNLAGRRVLVLEDEALIALTLVELVADLGCTIVGPAHSVEAGMALIREQAPDLAILDINLASQSNAPVARALQALEIPFIYCTGYAEPDGQIAPELAAETITKPVDPLLLAAALRRAAGARAERVR
jgi:PAS domain S-box-containing protein